MGWAAKIGVLFVGLIAFSLGVWLIGILCFIYLLAPLKPKKGAGGPSTGTGGTPIGRGTVLALVFALLALVAFASGGTLSPLVFLSLATLAYLWRRLPFGSLFSEVVAEDDSILLRSRYFPIVWFAIAEVKPGADDLPRALSSFVGRLMIVKRSGTVYTYATAFALNARTAEEALVSRLRQAASSISLKGAYLLPLDSRTASELLSWRLSLIKPPVLGEQGSDIIVLGSRGAFVNKASEYAATKVDGAKPKVLFTPKTLAREIFLWDFLQALGKAQPWHDPDSFSNLLESLHATRSEPIVERLNGVDSSEGTVVIQTLGGDRVELSRAQLRIVMAMYP
jgi:hypothetical protein